MDAMTQVSINFFGSYGLQYAMAAIVFITAFFLDPEKDRAGKGKGEGR